MVPDATHAIEILADFHRDIADHEDQEPVLDRLVEVMLEDLDLGIAVFLTRPDGQPDAVRVRGVPAAICERFDDVFLDAHIARDLVSGLEPWHGSSWLLVSGGGLYGAVAVFSSEPIGALRAAVGQSLTDATAIALDRIHKTRALEQSIEDLEQSRAELARAHTLEALGKMAAVMAHEVRNPLASVGGVLQILRTRFPEDSSDRKMFDKVLERLDDLNKLLSELLGFARPTRAERKPVSLDTVVRDGVASFIAAPAHAGVEVELELEPVEVNGDVSHLRGVLDNLMLNAAQAMEGQGRIGISLSQRAGRSTLVIDDTGPGIPEDVRATLFEPFVTTKTKGTGLGLAMVQRVVEAHQGTIAVGESPSGGARFTLVLPTI